jgi:hypothetical protein
VWQLVLVSIVTTLRRMIPRVAMMSAVAGVSLTFITMSFTFQVLVVAIFLEVLQMLL